MLRPTRIVAFIPLHEEMRYIDARLRRLGWETFPQSSRYDASRQLSVYEQTTSDRRRFSMMFHVLDAADNDVMGNISTAATVGEFLGRYEPTVAFLIGLAGSLKPATVQLGDVVIANTAKFLWPDKLRKVDHEREAFVDLEAPADPGAGAANVEGESAPRGKMLLDRRKRFLDEGYFRFRRDFVRNEISGPRLAAYRDYLARHPLPELESRNRAATEQPRVHFGAMLGSEWVVDSEEYVRFLIDRDTEDRNDWYVQRGLADPKAEAEAKKRNRWTSEELLAVDMESYGFLKGVETYRGGSAGGMPLQAIVVRGISDLALDKSALDQNPAGGERGRAVHNAALVAIDLIAWLTESGATLR